MKNTLIATLALMSCGVPPSNSQEKLKIAYNNMENSIPMGSFVSIDKSKAISRGDIVLLKHANGYAAYRVLAIPGDYVAIDSYRVSVNHKIDTHYNKFEKPYIITGKPSDLKYFNTQLKSQERPERVINDSMITKYCNQQEYEQLKEAGWNITPESSLALNNNNPFVQPDTRPTKDFLWQAYIPKPNEIFKKDNKSNIYGVKDRSSGDKIKENLYYLLNDNIDYLSDSRDLGLIPQDSIIGVVTKVHKINTNTIFVK